MGTPLQHRWATAGAAAAGLSVWLLSGCQQPAAPSPPAVVVVPPPISTPTPTPAPPPMSAPATGPIQPLPPAREPLSDYARRLEGRHAAGYYVNGVRAGYLIYQVRRVPVPFRLRPFAPGEQSLVEETVESELGMEMMGQVSRHQEKTRLYYSLKGPGPLVWAEADTRDDKNEEHLLVRRRGPKHEVWVDGKLARIVPESRMTLAQTQSAEQWLVDPARRPGDRTQTFEAEWKETPVDHPSVITYRGRGQAMWREKPLQVYDVDLQVQGLVLQGQVTRHLLPLKASAAGLLEIRLEEESEARKLGGVARWTDWGLPVDRALAHPQQLKRIRLRADSRQPLNLPQNHRQQVQAVGEGWEITLQRETMKPRPEALSAADRKRYLEADYTTRCNDLMVKLARRTTARSRTVPGKAAALQAWVYHYLQASSVGQAVTAQDVFRMRRGDCTEHSLLFVAMARACGIPTRFAHGVMYVEGESPCFGWHQWAEIHDGSGWVGVDPTWNQLGVDATHLLFGNDPRDLSSFNQIGRMKLRLLSKE